MDKTLLKQYVSLDHKFKELEEQKSLLREQIIADFRKNKIEKVDSDYGSFTICQKKNWKYSDKIVLLENKVKIAKNREQEKGIAVISLTDYLMYKTNE